MIDFTNFQRWILPVSLLGTSVILGLIIEKIILPRLANAAASSKWKVDNLLVDSLHGMPLIWLFLAGLSAAMASSPVPFGYTKAVTKLIYVILILTFTVLAARLGAGYIDFHGKKTGANPSATILRNLTRVFVYLIGALSIVHIFGVNITPALTALGVGGLAVALALQDTLSNFFSGLQVIASRQISTGDYIKLESGEEGYVSDITWRCTTLRTLPNSRVIVPNSKLASNLVTNYYLPNKEIAVLLQVGVGYSSDLGKVERATVEIAKEVMRDVPGGVPEFEPFIRFHTFGDFSINFTVILRGKEFADQHIIKHEFVKKLHERYRKENIEIPFPIRTVIMKNEEAIG
jgi:small-conductance mechanosensitive channel